MADYYSRAERIAHRVRQHYAANRTTPTAVAPEKYALMVAWPLWRLVRTCVRNRDLRLFVTMLRERWRWRAVR